MDSLYDQIKSDVSVEATLTTGTSFDRLSGIDYFRERATGATVLDVGSHRGLISYELARYGARSITGLDVYDRGVRFSRELFKETGVEHRFERCDLSGGVEGINRLFPDVLSTRYDVVLFLAVYHHIKKQMEEEALRRLVEVLLRQTRRFFALRTPLADELIELLPSGEFELVYRVGEVKSLAPLFVFRRICGP